MATVQQYPFTIVGVMGGTLPAKARNRMVKGLRLRHAEAKRQDIKAYRDKGEGKGYYPRLHLGMDELPSLISTRREVTGVLGYSADYVEMGSCKRRLVTKTKARK